MPTVNVCVFVRCGPITKCRLVLGHRKWVTQKRIATKFKNWLYATNSFKVRDKNNFNTRKTASRNLKQSPVFCAWFMICNHKLFRTTWNNLMWFRAHQKTAPRRSNWPLFPCLCTWTKRLNRRQKKNLKCVYNLSRHFLFSWGAFGNRVAFGVYTNSDSWFSQPKPATY